MDLQLTLIILGSIAIIGLLIHGLWVSRKNQPPEAHWSKDDLDYDSPDLGLDNEDVEGLDDPLADNIDLPDPINDGEQFDEYGLGKVSTISSTSNLNDIPRFDENTSVAPAEPEVDDQEDEPVVYASVVSNPKPQTKTVIEEPALSNDIPQPPKHFLQDAVTESIIASEMANQSDVSDTTDLDLPSAEVTEQPSNPIEEVPIYTAPIATHASEPVIEEPPKKPSLTEQAKNLVIRKNRRTTVRNTPKINDDQMRIDFDTVDPVLNETKATAKAQDEPAHDIEPEFLSLNIRAVKAHPISGAGLLASMLTLGFKFGESDIFHRHVNSNGKGPVLFSIANMFKPGIFDVHNMESQQFHGLTLFMSLPIEGDAHQVFNMMHNAARKLADEFGAEVLDEHRSGLTQQGLQHYVERIREFERRRLLGQPKP